MSTLRFRWVHAVDHCGCQHADVTQCSAATNGETTCCPVIPADDDFEAEVDEHNCPNFGLPPCTDDVFSWVINTVPEGTAGALPVWEVRA